MVTRGLGMVSTLVLAHLLVPADFGLVAMATTFTAAIDGLSSLGVTEALVRRPDTLQRWYPTAFTFQALRGVLTGSVIALGAHFMGDWFHEPRLEPIMGVLALMSVLAGLENIGVVEFRRQIQFGMEFRLLFVPRILQFATTIGLAWYLESYWALIAGIVMSGTTRLVMTYRVHRYRPRVSLEHWRDLLGFSFWTWAAGLASLVWERCDAFVLGPVMGSGPFGIYLLAAEVAVLPLSELVSPAMRALYSGVSVERGRGTEMASLALSVSAALLMIVLPLTIGFSATSGYIVAGLLGPKWEAARPMIATFSWLCCMAPISYVCSTVLNAQGQVRRNFLAIAGSAAVRVAIMSVVAASGRIDLAPTIAVGCAGVESVLFLTQLRSHGDPHWADHAGGFARLLVAAAVTVGILLATHLGWEAVSMAWLPALLTGGALGLLSIAVFAAVLLAQWQAFGRPPGPERRVIDLGWGVLAAWRAQRVVERPA